MRRRLKWAGALLLVLVLSRMWAPPVYFGESVSGRIVDAKSMEPIAGAVVVAQWRLHVGFVRNARTWVAAEAVTGSDGTYIIPGWGPRLRPLLSRMSDNQDPGIVVFKAGYEPERLFNDRSGEWAFVRRSDWNGKMIALVPFSGEAKERLRQLESVKYECWDAPRAGVALPRLRDELVAAMRSGVPPGAMLPSSFDLLAPREE